MRERETMQVIGGLYFTRSVVSYFIDPAYWGRGYGSDVVRGCCEPISSVLRLAQVTATILRENLASRRILEGAGFRFVGLASERRKGRAASLAILHYRLARNL